jgi:hypothetical protein
LAISSGGVAILITAVAAFIAAVGGIAVGMQNKSTLTEVREYANGQYAALRLRCAQLERELARHKVPVPDDPAVTSD